LIIEINAHQKSYALDDNLNKYLASEGVKLRPHFTGKNKWDTSFGVAAMSGLFGSIRDGKHQGDNLITLPSHEGNEHFKALINQLITWKPDTKNATDLIMALWFCEIRARDIVNSNTFKQTHFTSRWASRRAVSTQSVVNLDDIEFGNYTQYL